MKVSYTESHAPFQLMAIDETFIYWLIFVVERQWLWAFPQIEGVPPSPRGGHSATLTGASLVVFGGHYYEGQESGFKYLNDTYVLDVNSSRWIKPKI